MDTSISYSASVFITFTNVFISLSSFRFSLTIYNNYVERTGRDIY